MVIKFGIANSLPGCTGWASEAITEQVGLCRSEGFNRSSIYLFKAEEPIVFQSLLDRCQMSWCWI
jgi:hypothetical protein